MKHNLPIPHTAGEKQCTPVCVIHKFSFNVQKDDLRSHPDSDSTDNLSSKTPTLTNYKKHKMRHYARPQAAQKQHAPIMSIRKLKS